MMLRAVALLLCALSLTLAPPRFAAAAESRCYGTTSHGRLEGGVRIPPSNRNYTPYSRLGVVLGRTYAHARVASSVADAYAALARTAPTKVFVYGESGWPDGGRIRPHRTHQNGLSVDFMVPVVDARGESVRLPGSVTNEFGYAIEFDQNARYNALTIDFDAIATHLKALHAAARANGIGVSRVIFDRRYQPKLFATRDGAWVRDNVSFMRTEPWIRHDEHYHVDFAVACRPL